jgi:signal transduction histidine kinase
MPHTLSTISDLSILTDTLLLLGTDPLSLPKNDIDVYTLVRNIYTKMQHIHTREDIHLDIPTDIPHVHGHISLVSILYRNILENALKYALPGAISIVYADGIYSIKNNATYISPQDIEYIWEDGNTYGGK